MQVLEFGTPTNEYGVKFTRNDDGEVVSAAYQCRACHEMIDEHHKTWMLAHGEWRAPNIPAVEK
jgi:phage terminase large subunit GpA-like protein